MIFNLATHCRKISFKEFKEFKVSVRGVMLTYQKWNSFYGVVILWMRMTSEVFTPQGIVIEAIIRGLVLT